MRYLILTLCLILSLTLSFCVEEEISEQQNEGKNNFNLTSIDNSKYTFMNSSLLTNFEATNIDKNLVGRWAWFHDTSGTYRDGYYIYSFYKNGRFYKKKCKDVYCNELMQAVILDGIFFNIDKYHIDMRYETEYSKKVKVNSVYTYFINENNLYFSDVYVKVKSYKDKSIYGKYEYKDYYLAIDSESGQIYHEYYYLYTLDIKIDNTINLTEYHKSNYGYKHDFKIDEETKVIYDNYEFELLNDRLLVKHPEKKYYFKYNGPFNLHDIRYYKYYGDILRWGSDIDGKNPTNSGPYWEYNEKKDVLEDIYRLYEPYKKVE